MSKPAVSVSAPVAPRRRVWMKRLLWVGLAVVLAAVATLDYWAPPVATAWVGGVSSAGRETRVGRTVVWSDLVWTGDGIEFAARRLEVSAPTRMLTRGRVDATGEGWRLRIATDGRAKAAEGTGTEAEGREVFGWPELVEVLREVGTQLERRVGEATLSDGRVETAGEVFEVPELAVKGGAVSGVVRWREETVKFTAEPGAGRVAATVREREAEVRLVLSREAAEGVVSWLGNKAPVAATFAAGAWRPASFTVRGEEWTIPAAKLKWAEGAGELRGGFLVRADGDGLAATLAMRAEPRGEGSFPVRIEAALRADAESVRVERLVVDAPQVQAELSAPLEWRWAGAWAGDAGAVFKWKTELGAWSGGTVAGRAEGTARWHLGEAWRVEWTASGADLAWREFKGITATLSGETTAAETRVNTAEVSGARADLDGLRVKASGIWRHAERRVEDGEISAAVTGAALSEWLLEGVTFGRVEIGGKVTGTLAELAFDGEVKASAVAYGDWSAEEVAVSLRGGRETDWEGSGRARRAAATLEVAGTVNRTEAKLTALRLARGDGAALVLRKPAEVRFAGAERTVKVALTGDDGRGLAVSWKEGEALAMEATGLDSGWANDWRGGVAWPMITVREVAVRADVTEAGWLSGEGAVELSAKFGSGAEWRARGAAKWDEGGMELSALEVGQGERRIVDGAGTVPWRVRAADGKIEPVPGAEWAFRLATRADAELWSEVAKWTGLGLEAPELTVELAGPATAPRGRMQLAATRVVLRDEELPLDGLELRDVALEARVAEDEVVITQLRAKVDGQGVEAQGRLDLAKGDWERLRARPWAWLRDHAEAKVSLPEAQVAALARYLPTLLAPVGTVAAELVLSPGARLDGKVTLRAGASRPLGDFGVLHDIELELVLAGLDVRVARASAQAGGQTVTVTGGGRRAPGKGIELDLELRAERFPLVRRPGLVLRGDLALTVKTDADGRTRLGGDVLLRDSLFLMDIRPLISSGGGGSAAAAVRARPPYFSVDTAPLGDWTLGVTVRGPEFLRMRTPILDGRGSTRFTLAGTLREPRVEGEFTVDTGRILFPFASFTVQEGTVRILRNDPYTPRLNFRAQGRRLGYDLRLELTGTAERPVLRFFSTPALDAESLLLMITAGVAPVEGRSSGSAQRWAAVGAYVGRDLLRTLGVASTDEERLSLRTGEQVSRNGRETYGFDFRLNDRWYLVGDYDEFDAYNMGIKRRFRAAEPREEGR